MTSNADLPRADFSEHSQSRWEDLIGSERAKQSALAVMHYRGVPPKMFLTGPAGSGKSSIINHLCATAACYEPKGNDPCGQWRAARRSSRAIETLGFLRWPTGTGTIRCIILP